MDAGRQRRSLNDLQHAVHVWTANLRIPAQTVERFRSILSDEEKERADRFRFEALSHAFIVAHAALRCLLGNYLNLDPESIRFRYGPKGKPALSPPSRLEFNMTHSGNVAGFAFTEGCQLGLDLEQIEPLNELESIARSFFCTEEYQELTSLPPESRVRAFFLCWTRKEAYIKATGDGLAAPLHEFRVTLNPTEPARFVSVGSDREEAGRWMLHDLSIAPSFAAALAYRSSERRIVLFPMEDTERIRDNAPSY